VNFELARGLICPKISSAKRQSQLKRGDERESAGSSHVPNSSALISVCDAPEVTLRGCF
jgi:hypothetical protein